jgi:two-component system, chemotaxis family, protein-glutamate methylesterase/glutaminase
MDKKQTGHDIIVIGGSAGAMAPLRTLLAQLPTQFDASIFVVVHMPASGTGVLRAVASAVSQLPVSQAREDIAFEPGHVYLAIPDHHLLLTDAGRMRLGRGPRENMARPAIDALFRSAAVAYGPRVIGVLLSGMLNDGVAGLEAIKRCGGFTVVQDPDEAVADEMPRNALRAVTVDAVAPVARLSETVCELQRRPAGAQIQVPRDIQLEVEIAAGERIDSASLRPVANPAPLTCPSCGGVMSRIRTGKVLRFRCQVGHAMTAEVLAREQEGAVDEALRVALRVIEERAELVTRMAEDSRASERGAVAQIYEQRAAEYRNYTDVLRRAILLSMDAAPSQEAGEAS